MKKLDMQTPDITEENIDKIAELFPNVMTEKEGEGGETTRAIDFELLQQELSGALVDDDSERYRLDWPGKKASLLKANTPITKTLRPDRESSVDFDTTENVYIEGDNFEVLKILQESYLGKVKMIYIDPPYNTGKDFVYKDNTTQSKEEYEEELGVEDEDGGKLFKNTDTNGRFHSDWLSMMYERLTIARDLLKEDGVIFMSIDDNEVHNLRKIADEIFGEDNFVNQVTIKTKASSGASGGGEDKRLKKNIEHLLIYTRSSVASLGTLYKKDLIDDYIENHKRKKIGFYYTRVLISTGDREFVKELNGIKIYRHSNHKFETISNIMKVEKLSLMEAYAKYFDKIFMVTNAQTSILEKVNNELNGEQLLVSYEYVPSSGRNKGKITTKFIWNKTLVVWFQDSAEKQDNTVFKKQEVGTLWDDISWGRLDIEGGVKFNNGKKPTSLIVRLLKISTNTYDIILDFFSGSATTAHAVMQLNAEDGGNRKCISVQLPEKTDEKSEAFKAGYKTIAEIGRERIRRAGKKILEENKVELAKRAAPLDVGFRVYKTDTTNMKDVYYHPSETKQESLLGLADNIKEDRTPEDLLTQVMLDLGLTLDLPLEKKEIKGNTVYFVQGNALVACFDDNIDFSIVDEIAKVEPLKVVFKDASFKDDKDRINLETKFKQLSPDTKIKVL